MKNDPAFPTFEASERFNDFTGHYEEGPLYPRFGLTKRELFAAMAMQGLCSTFTVGRDQAELQTATAQSSVKYADALLAELGKVTNET